MIERITSAILFRTKVYRDTANDPAFTSDAWIIVVVVAFLNQLGAKAALVEGGGFFKWVLGTVLGTAFEVLAFALGAWLVGLVARSLFRSTVTFAQLQRAMGLAYVWRAIGVLGIFTAISPVLVCLTAPLGLVVLILGMAAYLFAIKEAAEMDWVGTIVTVVVTLVVGLAVTAIAAAFFAILGLGAAAVGGALP